MSFFPAIERRPGRVQWNDWNEMSSSILHRGLEIKIWIKYFHADSVSKTSFELRPNSSRANEKLLMLPAKANQTRFPVKTREDGCMFLVGLCGGGSCPLVDYVNTNRSSWALTSTQTGAVITADDLASLHDTPFSAMVHETHILELNKKNGLWFIEEACRGVSVAIGFQRAPSSVAFWNLSLACLSVPWALFYLFADVKCILFNSFPWVFPFMSSSLLNSKLIGSVLAIVWKALIGCLVFDSKEGIRNIPLWKLLCQRK